MINYVPTNGLPLMLEMNVCSLTSLFRVSDDVLSSSINSNSSSFESQTEVVKELSGFRINHGKSLDDRGRYRNGYN